MIMFLRGTDLFMFPELASSMFTDRKFQFLDRLGWDLYVDNYGNERDQYDLLNPHYVIVSSESGRHAASLRLLPSTGSIMVNDHFSQAMDGQLISSPEIWECTRLCRSTGANRLVIPQLLAATGFYMKEMGISQLVGVFTTNMLRQYALFDAHPEIIGTTMADGENVFVGVWDFQTSTFDNLRGRAQISPDELELSFVNAPSFKLLQKMTG